MQTRTRLWSSLFSIVLGGSSLVILTFLAFSVDVSQIQAAPSATLYVDVNLGDDANACTGPGASACETIEEAIDKASNGDTIEIAAGTYFEHDIQVDKEVTLEGDSAKTTIIDANFQGRVFDVDVASTIARVTIQNGRVFTTSSVLFDRAGAGIINSGDLTLYGVTLYNNEAQSSGGAIFTLDNLTIESSSIISNKSGGNGGGLYQYNTTDYEVSIDDSLISENQALALQGGGIYATRPTTIYGTVISHNSAPNSGGGLALNSMADPREVYMERVTLNGNEAQAGGAVIVQGGGMELVNVTVSGNTASNNYGGLYATGAESFITVTNSTIANNDRTNTSGVGRNGLNVVSGASATVVNTIFADNEENNCGASGSWTTLGYNVSSDFSCSLTGTNDEQGVDPQLLPLIEIEEVFPYHPIRGDSPAVDTGSNVYCPATDLRGIARPFDGDNDGTATCDKGAYEVTPQLEISDLSILEGDTGSATAQFTVTLSPTSTLPVTVLASTTDGSALAVSDYTAVTDQVVAFAPGEGTKFVSVDIIGDTADENDETFTVTLSSNTNALLLDGQAIGTIIDNDGLPSLAISDQTIEEGNIGTKSAVFEVTLSPAATTTVNVNVATANDTATAGSDYTAVVDTLTFDPGETVQTVSVDILGDVIDEGSSETFVVNLSGPTNAKVTDGSADGTIADDDEAIIEHDFGPQISEGDSGTTTAYFTVTLTTPAAFTIMVDYEVREGVGDDGAKFGSDITGTLSGTVTFDPGETVQTYPVEIIGDYVIEEDEPFSSLLSNAVPTIPIQPNSSLATIINDDDQYLVMIPLVVRE